MSVVASGPRPDEADRTSERVSWRGVLWVAPLTVVVSALVCVGLRTLLQAIDPSLQRMGRRGGAGSQLFAGHRAGPGRRADADGAALRGATHECRPRSERRGARAT